MMTVVLFIFIIIYVKIYVFLHQSCVVPINGEENKTDRVKIITFSYLLTEI